MSSLETQTTEQSKIDAVLLLPDLATRRLIEEAAAKALPNVAEELGLDPAPNLIIGFPHARIPPLFDPETNKSRNGIEAAINQANKLRPKEGKVMSVLFGSTASWLAWSPESFAGDHVRVINGYTRLAKTLETGSPDLRTWKRALLQGAANSFLGEETAKILFRTFNFFRNQTVASTFGTDDQELLDYFVHNIDRMGGNYTSDLLGPVRRSNAGIERYASAELIYLAQTLTGTTREEREEVAADIGFPTSSIRLDTEIRGVVPTTPRAMHGLLKSLLYPFSNK